MSYRFRLTLLTCAALALTLLLAASVIYGAARRDAYAQIDDALKRQVEVSRAFEAAGIGGGAFRDRVGGPGRGPGGAIPGTVSNVANVTIPATAGGQRPDGGFRAGQTREEFSGAADAHSEQPIPLNGGQATTRLANGVVRAVRRLVAGVDARTR